MKESRFGTIALFRLMAALGCLFPCWLYGEQEVDIYVDDSYYPYSFSQDGKAKGLYINVLNAVFSKMPDFKVTLTPFPWSRGKSMMEQGRGFALFPAYFHGHDWPYLYPYSLPIYTETVLAVCREGVKKDRDSRWPQDFENKSIGNVTGFDGWGGKLFHEMVKNKKIQYFETQESRNLIKMFFKRRLDCILMERRAFDFELNKLLITGELNPEDLIAYDKHTVVGVDAVYIGYSEPALKSGKYPYEYAFRKQFDIVLYEMTKSGEIDRIMGSF